jgi:hypothetical protein
MEHFWKIVFVIVLLVAGYFWYDRWQSKTEGTDRMDQILTLIEENKNLPASASGKRAGESLYRVLALLRSFEKSSDESLGVMLDDMFKKAVEAERLTNDEVPVLDAAINANLKVCRELGVFEDDGMTMMEAGRPPTIRSGPFSRDKLIIGHLVPPLIAPEAKKHFANLVLTPESVFALQNEDIDRQIFNRATTLRGIGVVNHGTLARIKKRDRDSRAYRIGE